MACHYTISTVVALSRRNNLLEKRPRSYAYAELQTTEDARILHQLFAAYRSNLSARTPASQPKIPREKGVMRNVTGAGYTKEEHY